MSGSSCDAPCVFAPIQSSGASNKTKKRGDQRKKQYKENAIRLSATKYFYYHHKAINENSKSIKVLEAIEGVIEAVSILEALREDASASEFDIEAARALKDSRVNELANAFYNARHKVGIVDARDKAIKAALTLEDTSARDTAILAANALYTTRDNACKAAYARAITAARALEDARKIKSLSATIKAHNTNYVCTICNGQRGSCICLLDNLPPGLLELNFTGKQIFDIYDTDDLIETKNWTRSCHADFSYKTNDLFETLFLGIQHLENTGVLQEAHQMMFEFMLECWTDTDDFELNCRGWTGWT